MPQEIKEALGSSWGVVFKRPGYDTVYVAGETIWTPRVESAIKEFNPEVIILNTAYACIQGYDGSIIMGKENLLRASRLAPKATILGVHMDTINHGGETREDLVDYIALTGMNPRKVLVPKMVRPCASKLGKGRRGTDKAWRDRCRVRLREAACLGVGKYWADSRLQLKGRHRLGGSDAILVYRAGNSYEMPATVICRLRMHLRNRSRAAAFGVVENKAQ